MSRYKAMNRKSPNILDDARSGSAVLSQDRALLSKLILPLFVTEDRVSSEKIASEFARHYTGTQEIRERIDGFALQGLSKVLLYPMGQAYGNRSPRILSSPLTSSRALSSQAIAADAMQLALDSSIVRAVRSLSQCTPTPFVTVDLCTCHILGTSQCGIVRNGAIDAESTFLFLEELAITLAGAGVDALCISTVLDGIVMHIRSALDRAGFSNVLLMSQSGKIHSGLYGPFQRLSGGLADRQLKVGYQLQVANEREHSREILIDGDEGADMIILKPSSYTLDTPAQEKHRYGPPLLGYTTAGEYLMLKTSYPSEPDSQRVFLRDYFQNFLSCGLSGMISYAALDFAHLLYR